jgi:hypothetical protein
MFFDPSFVPWDIPGLFVILFWGSDPSLELDASLGAVWALIRGFDVSPLLVGRRLLV